jgi:hypothetical protein
MVGKYVDAIGNLELLEISDCRGKTICNTTTTNTILDYSSIYCIGSTTILYKF